MQRPPHTVVKGHHAESPPELERGETPFEARPQRFVRTRKLIRHVSRKREKPPSVAAIGLFVLVFFGGGLGVRYFDDGYLLFAWLMAGPLFVTVYLTYEGRGSLLNPYTLFFATVLTGCVAAHFMLL